MEALFVLWVIVVTEPVWSIEAEPVVTEPPIGAA